MNARVLPPAELTVALDAGMLQFADTSQIVAQDCGWIGQQRAEKAARFGLQLEQPGYNLFVLGGPGSGRSSLLFRAMQEVAEKSPAAPDLVFLYNFDQADRPLALRLHNGQGAALRTALERFSANVAHDIPHQLHAEGYRLDSERLKKSHRQRIDRAYFELVAFASARSFALRRDDGRLVFTLLGEGGQAMQEEAVLALSSEQRVALEDAEQELRVEIGKYLEFVRPIEQETENALTLLRRETAEPVVQREIGALREVFTSRVLDEAKFAGYLTRLAEDVLGSLDAFTAEGDNEDAVAELLARYRANLAVDNAGMRGAPALRDDDPLFRSLFGGVDYQVENGVLVTNYLHIRPGNLLRAHGGYLMLHLRDVLRDAAVWEKLQRYLRSGRLQIEEPAAASGQLAAKMLEPEALDVQVKLVLIGSRGDYYDLQEMDPEFTRHFRVKVDFIEHFPADAEVRHAIGVFIAQRCQTLGLPHFSAAAVTHLLIDMQREIDDQRRMSAGLGHLEAMVVESAAYCKARSGTQVSAEDVLLALDERRARHDYPERSLLDAISDGEVMIHVQGQVTGQINGLTQIDLGDYRFGSPVRISARTYAGDEGVINIDREVEMSGPTHDKGVYILQGWLSAAFARQTPLSLTASLVFEQEYHGVEGDSASCAELYAILSALAELPLAQGIAVTGALNQHGEVMPVGGINEKIEGWFRTCSRLGLTGQQGVLIPARNSAHLVLAQDVRDAVAQGRFRVLVMDRVEDGISLLTGLPAGVPDDTGAYPADSVFGRVQQALEYFRRACDESGHHEHGHGK